MIREIYIISVDSFYELKRNCWAGALQTLEAIEEKGLQDQFISYIDNLIQDVYYERGIEMTRLNDFIWFDTEIIEEDLGVKLWND